MAHPLLNITPSKLHFQFPTETQENFIQQAPILLQIIDSTAQYAMVHSNKIISKGDSMERQHKLNDSKMDSIA